MPRHGQREATGVLERHGDLLFLNTKTGHHWRLEVSEERVRGLVGVQVWLMGHQAGNTITVEGIRQN